MLFIKKYYLFLAALLVQVFGAFIEVNAQQAQLSVTISTTLDTFNASHYYKEKLFENDSFFKITIQNTGATEIELPQSLGPSYENEPSGFVDYYFHTFYDSNSRIVAYNKQTTDIDYFDFPEADSKYVVLQPGEKRIIFDNPLTINGVPDGLNRVYVEVYLRLPSSRQSFKSNRLSLISIHK